jgi:phosphoribosylglycinamide formyltransferase-1
MYGQHVHLAVSAAKEAYSGISIHLVNEEFDKGKLLFQHAVALTPNSTAAEIEQKVRALEIQHFAPDLEAYVTSVTK